MTIDEERDIACVDPVYHQLTLACLHAAGEAAGEAAGKFDTAYYDIVFGCRSAMADRAEELGCLRLASVHRALAKRWA